MFIFPPKLQNSIARFPVARFPEVGNDDEAGDEFQAALLPRRQMTIADSTLMYDDPPSLFIVEILCGAVSIDSRRKGAKALLIARPPRRGLLQHLER